MDVRVEMPFVHGVATRVLLFAIVGACGVACSSDADGPQNVAQDSGSKPSSRAGSGDEQPQHDAGMGANHDAGAGECDMRGAWVTQHVTTNSALGTEQIATNWNYHRFAQQGTTLTIEESLDCGYVVRGSTDVSLADATLEAMAKHSTNAAGVQGELRPSADGEGCTLAMDRIYTIRGANKAMFLDAVWQIGDPPKELSDFTLPANEAEGMEDWDDDGHEAITQLTGLGDRYTAQIDWHAFHGTVPRADLASDDAVVGGEDVLLADYDAIESVSEETPALLRTSSVPMSPGYALMVRADALELASGDHAELDSCKRVQALAVARFGDPPTP